MVNLDNFFKRMLDLNTTAKKVSEKTGISTGNISDWKSGRCLPSAEKLAKIADCLDCSVDYLLGRTNDSDLSFNPDTDFYRLLFSDKGLKTILKQLKPMVDDYGIDKLADELNISFTDIRQCFDIPDWACGNKCLERLSSIFAILDTNAYELIKNSVLKEHKKQSEINGQTDYPDLTEQLFAAYGSHDEEARSEIEKYIEHKKQSNKE